MSESTVTYADFAIEHTFAAPVSKVYQAFADKQAKELWFHGPTDNGGTEHTMDFRVGGNELNRGRFHDGTVHTFKACYYDIVPEQRIVYAYEMYLGNARISVSLATIELSTEGDKTHLLLHETGVFLDNLDNPENRERGSRELLKTLEASLT